SEPRRGHPHDLSTLAPPNIVVSRLNRPARPRAFQRFASRVTPCCATNGLPRGRLLPGVGLARSFGTALVSHSPTSHARSPPVPTNSVVRGFLWVKSGVPRERRLTVDPTTIGLQGIDAARPRARSNDARRTLRCVVVACLRLCHFRSESKA